MNSYKNAVWLVRTCVNGVWRYMYIHAYKDFVDEFFVIRTCTRDILNVHVSDDCSGRYARKD